MYYCPTCRIPLEKNPSKFGIFWSCPSCNGRATSIYVLRKVISQEIVNKLWQRAKSGQYEKFRICPVCRKDLPEVPVISNKKTICLDICTKCYYVWFDSSEYESLPKVELPKSEEEELSPEAREALALLKLETMKTQKGFIETISSGKVYEDDAPEYVYQKILGYFGFPIECNPYQLQHRPIVTWLIGALMVITTVLCLGNLDVAIEKFGMIPAKFYRYYGFTFISSFFIHAGMMHLLGNLYFLIVFGDNVEDVLGRKKYILLIIFAALLGEFLHIIGDPNKQIPCVGASGGISGILIYYCLRFPDAKINLFYFFFYRFAWFSFNIKFFIGLWIFIQIMVALEQKAGMSDVSAFAHLGGAIVGFSFWAFEKYTLSKSMVETT